MFFRLDGLNAVTSQNTPTLEPSPTKPLGLETDTDNITEDETDMQDIMTPLGGAGALQGQGNLEPYIPDTTEETFEPGMEPPETGAAEGTYNMQAQGYNQGTTPAGMGMSDGYYPQGAAPMSSGIPGAMNPIQGTYPWQTAGTMPGTMYYCPSCPMLYGQQAYGQQMMPVQGQQAYGQQMYGQQMPPMQGQLMSGAQMLQMPYQGGTNYNRQFGIMPFMLYGSQGNYYNDFDDDYDFDHDYDYDDDHDYDHDHNHVEFNDIEDYDYDSHYDYHDTDEDHD